MFISKTPCTTPLDTDLVQRFTYTYDLAGNIASIKNQANQTTSFTYDGLNRLTNAAGPLYSQSMVYDPQTGNSSCVP